MMTEDDKCPECEGKLSYPKIVNCSCHIHAPCSACVDNKLTCEACGWEEPLVDRAATSFRSCGSDISEVYHVNPVADLGKGKRLFDFDYSGASGSTMVYRGKYKGDVTAEDILAYFGTGTFGHRGPFLSDGRFEFTKITD